MKNKKSIFGWPSVFRFYSNKDLIRDSLFPILISMCVTAICYWEENDMLVELFKLVTIGLSVVPAMLSILLAAYAILMSMYWSSISEKIKHNEKGNKLLNDLNSSFAGAIKVIWWSLLYLLIVNSVGVVNMPFNIIPCSFINILLFFVTLYCILFSIWIIKDIAINIYNFASFAINADIKDKQEDDSQKHCIIDNCMIIQEIANSFAEGKANENVTKIIGHAYKHRFNDGYKSGKENAQIECNDTEFIDLGLPSGTLWASDYLRDSEGKVCYLPYVEAVKYSIPSIEQWRELEKCCQWVGRYDKRTIDCVGPNGNVVSFSFTGYVNSTKKVEYKTTYLWLFSQDTDTKNSVYIDYDEDKPGEPFLNLKNSFCGFKLPVRLVR